jgi:hypothetical protein
MPNHHSGVCIPYLQLSYSDHKIAGRQECYPVRRILLRRSRPALRLSEAVRARARGLVLQRMAQGSGLDFDDAAYLRLLVQGGSSHAAAGSTAHLDHGLRDCCRRVRCLVRVKTEGLRHVAGSMVELSRRILVSSLCKPSHVLRYLLIIKQRIFIMSLL